MKASLLFSLLFLSLSLQAQFDKDVDEVQAQLVKQAESWNAGDLDAFMETYWNSDQLQFIGPQGVTYGWQETLDGYKERYPNKATMGELSFEIIDVTRRGRKVISMIGRFFLKTDMGNMQGSFLLLWQKKKGQWVIVADHTSVES
ncbi:MAG: DUF4440 domain-containing protein [Bacteroidota bacterium]